MTDHPLLLPGTSPSLDEAVALFRYGLIADLLLLPPGRRRLHAQLRAKAEREYEIPITRRLEPATARKRMPIASNHCEVT